MAVLVKFIARTPPAIIAAGWALGFWEFARRGGEAETVFKQYLFLVPIGLFFWWFIDQYLHHSK